MRRPEEYNVNGRVNGEPVRGTLRAYPEHVKKANERGLTTSVAEPYRSNVPRPRNVRSYPIRKARISVLVLAGAITLTTFIGGIMIGLNIDTQKMDATPPAVAAVVEAKYPVEYIVKSGDLLSSIAGKAGSNDWQALYNANRAVIGDSPHRLSIGTKLIVMVPESRLEAFGYTTVYEDVNEWDAMEYFIYQCFDVPSSQFFGWF